MYPSFKRRLPFSTIFQDIGAAHLQLALNIVLARNVSFCFKQVNNIYLLVKFVQINDVDFYYHAVWFYFLEFVSKIEPKHIPKIPQGLTCQYPENGRQRKAR